MNHSRNDHVYSEICCKFQFQLNTFLQLELYLLQNIASQSNLKNVYNGTCQTFIPTFLCWHVTLDVFLNVHKQWWTKWMLKVDLEILLSCLRRIKLTRWLAETGTARYCTCERAHLLWYSAVLVPLTITFCSVPPLTFMFTNMYLNLPSGSMSTSDTLLRASAIFAADDP